jgi:hypothetical protein
MWAYYKKTFPLVQVTALLVSYLVYQRTNRAWPPAAVFFAIMQLSAVFGAMWASRLSKKIEARG